jgi:hypothetical protein
MSGQAAREALNSVAGNLWIASFGSDEDYLTFSREVTEAIAAAYPGSRAIVYSREDLPRSIRAYARKYWRGYGYWLWKPWLLRALVGRLPDGDVVLYVDGRTSASGARIPWLDRFMADPVADLVAWPLGLPEREWTTGDIFALFGQPLDSEDATETQFAGGLFAFRVNAASRRFIADWHDAMEANFPLCRDRKSVAPNHGTFRKNRHDQSMFSMTVKKHRRLGLAVLLMGEKDWDGSVLPQARRHPRRPGWAKKLRKWLIR